MSGWRGTPLGERVGYYLVRSRAWWHRATAAALAVRATVWVSGSAALALAVPTTVSLSAAVVTAALVAGVGAARPGGGWVGGLEITTVLLVAAAVWQDEASLPRIALVAALLYLHHAGAALGAELRTDTMVPAAVLWHLARRVAVVLGGAALLGAALLVLSPAIAEWSATLLIGVGAVAAVGVTVVLAELARRRRHPQRRGTGQEQQQRAGG
jgi:hypothetical protein